MNTNEELTAKQIARIARIRKERKEKLRKMNACFWCCDKTPEDQLIATVDGKHICITCVEDYNEDHKDTSYDQCDGCNKAYLCQYGTGLQPYENQYCPACDKRQQELKALQELCRTEGEVEVRAICWECGVEGKCLQIEGECEDWLCLDCSSW